MRGRGPESDECWDREIGAQWARVLQLHGFNPAGNVAEAGPGFTLKVGFGLRELGFRGTLYVVEPNQRISEWITNRYRELLPSARVIPVRARLHSAAASLPAGLDALLMNHLIDDLLLDAAIPGRRRAAIFGNMHPGAPCAPCVRRAWRHLAADPAKLASASRAAVEAICSLYRRTRPALLAINHYQSWFHTHNGLSVVDEITAPILRRLARRLDGGGTEFFDGNDESQARWLILSREQRPAC